MRYEIIERFDSDEQADAHEEAKYRRADGEKIIVKYLLNAGGNPKYVLYGARGVRVTRAAKVKPVARTIKIKKARDKIQKTITYNGKEYKFKGKYINSFDAENKLSDLQERGYSAKLRKIIYGSQEYFAIYAFKSGFN